MRRILLVIRSLDSLLKKHRSRFVIAAAAGVIGGFCSSGMLAVINLKLKGTALPYLPVPVLFLLLVVTYLLTSVFSEIVHLKIAEAELANLRFQLSKQLLTLPLRRLETIGSGNLFASLTDDLDKLILLIIKIPSFILNLSTAVGCAIYVVFISPPIAGMIALYLAICFALYLPPFQLAEKYMVVVRAKWSDLCRAFHSVTHGTKELLMHDQRRESFLLDRIQYTCDEIRINKVKGKTIRNFAFQWGVCLYFLGLGFLLFVASPWLGISNKDLTSIIWAGLYMIIPIYFVLNWGPDFQDIFIALQRLRDLGFSFDFDRADAAGETAAAIVGQEGRPLLELAGVRFAYFNREENESFIVGPISLTIHENEIIFLAGGNGSGKTTLMKIICGLYPPDAGEIRWLGERINEGNRGLYRQFFSAVFSDFYLFDELHGLDKTEVDSRSVDYLRRLKLHSKVSLSEGRLSTVDLSHGQRKRIALLVAFLEDRPFYIFDEWAADQDPIFKQIFYREIIPDLKRRRKTVLVISHDAAFYDVADRLFRLEDGHLKEDAA